MHSAPPHAHLIRITWELSSTKMHSASPHAHLIRITFLKTCFKSTDYKSVLLLGRAVQKLLQKVQVNVLCMCLLHFRVQKSKGNEIYTSKRYLNTHVNCLTAHSSLRQEINIAVHQQVTKWRKVWYIHTGEYCLVIREGNPVFCIKMYGAG